LARKKKSDQADELEPTRTITELQNILRNTVYNELTRLPELLQSLTPKERSDLIIKIMLFILPKSEKNDCDIFGMM
jgi:hypothetical protein